MLEIRNMKIEDVPEVSAIENACFTMPWSAKSFTDAIQQKNTLYYVAIEDGKVAGYCGMLMVLEESDITNVAVKEEFRGRGIAQALLTELLKEGNNLGIDRFILEVRESNCSAIHVYQKLGFEIKGIRKNFYEKPTEHAAIMWKQ